MEFLNTIVYDNTLRAWGIALGIGVVVLVALRVVQGIGVARLGKLAAKTHLPGGELVVAALRKTRLFTLLIVAFYLATLGLELPDRVRNIITNVTVVLLLLQAGVWIVAALNAWLERYRQRQLTADPAAVTTVSALAFLGKLAIWSAVLLLALDNLGINVTALITGLGIGGVAVALAVQNILGDLFASLSIVLDKPFVIGDFLIVDDHLGSVEHIGLKTTRLRSLSGEQLVFSNSDLLKSRIRNYGRMYERRVVFSIGVTYQTPREKLKMIPGVIREAVEAQEQTRFDRSHFKEYGNFSLNFETVYYVLSSDYNLYMDIQQGINLHIHERFEKEEIVFAYPTQTVFVAQEAA
jgi:small-conductance mechanosensitive channel